jgi:SH3 domain protein
MFKPFAVLLLFTSLSTALHAETEANITEQSVEPETAYITDNLFVYLHSGSSKQYRILGSIQAGTQLKIIANDSETGYIQVKDDRGRTGWVDKRNVSKLPGLAQQNQQLKMQLAELQSEINSSQRDMPVLRQSANQFEQENLALAKQVEQLKAEVASNRTQKLQSSEKQQQQLLMYGGGIAFIGIFIGMIITLMLSRRKSYDGWA